MQDTKPESRVAAASGVARPVVSRDDDRLLFLRLSRPRIAPRTWYKDGGGRQHPLSRGDSGVCRAGLRVRRGRILATAGRGDPPGRPKTRAIARLLACGEWGYDEGGQIPLYPPLPKGEEGAGPSCHSERSEESRSYPWFLACLGAGPEGDPPGRPYDSHLGLCVLPFELAPVRAQSPRHGCPGIPLYPPLPKGGYRVSAGGLRCTRPTAL